MSPLTIESTRSGVVESVHRVSVAVTDSEGKRVASAGEPGLVTFWRSAAKPFQALPMVMDGAADHWGFGSRALALACASHSSEPEHRALVEHMLSVCGCEEAQLACGPHPPLNPAVAEEVARSGVKLTPKWSNCSGKHSSMLALARHHGWPTEGYSRVGHPVQERIVVEVSRWTGVPRSELRLGVDGDGRCTPPALLAVLRQVFARLGAPKGQSLSMEGLAHHVEVVQRNTRGEITGSLRAAGELRFH